MRKRNRDIFFLFLTAGDSSRWAKALARIGRQGVDWLALQLSPAQVPEHLAAADIGVLLRRDHPVNAAASPTKLGEYLAAGLPVITTRFAGDAPGILDTSGCGIVLGDVLPTPPELIALDAFVMRHAGDRDTQGRLCRQLAMRSQSWEIASRELKALYERPPLVPHESDPVRPLT
jgi:glycosyltransferase involved in cell wall biosynthesis